MVHCVYVPYLYPALCWWKFRLLPYSGTIVNSASVNTEVCVSFGIMVFSECMPRGGITVSYGSSVFSFSKKIGTVLHNGFTNLHSHQQCKRVPISPHSLQWVCFLNHVCQRRRMDFLELAGCTSLRPSSPVSRGLSWQGCLHGIMSHCLSEDILHRLSLPSFRLHGLTKGPLTRQLSGFLFCFPSFGPYSHCWQLLPDLW